MCHLCLTLHLHAPPVPAQGGFEQWIEEGLPTDAGAEYNASTTQLLKDEAEVISQKVRGCKGGGWGTLRGGAQLAVAYAPPRPTRRPRRCGTMCASPQWACRCWAAQRCQRWPSTTTTPRCRWGAGSCTQLRTSMRPFRIFHWRFRLLPPPRLCVSPPLPCPPQVIGLWGMAYSIYNGSFAAAIQGAADSAASAVSKATEPKPVKAAKPVPKPAAPAAPAPAPAPVPAPVAAPAPAPVVAPAAVEAPAPIAAAVEKEEAPSAEAVKPRAAEPTPVSAAGFFIDAE